MAQVRDRDIHGAGFHIRLRYPYLFKQLGAGYGSGPVLVKPTEDAGFTSGQFNDLIADFAATTLKALPGEKRVWEYETELQQGYPIQISYEIANQPTA